MKVFKVPLYMINNQDMENLEFIDNIIIKKNIFSVTEILTGYNISILSSKDYKINNHSKIVVLEKDLNDNNQVLETDIDSYVEGFEQSGWNKMYKDIKTQEELERNIKNKKNRLREKVLEVYGTKK